MYLRSKSSTSSAAQTVAQQQATSNANALQAEQTNLLSPEAAASLAQGAAPMAYMGGDIYNNILNQQGQAPVAPGPAPAPATLTPGTSLLLPAAVQGTNTVSSLAKAHGLTVAQLLAANPGLSANSVNVGVNIPYTVQTGDTFESVGKAFGISPNHVQAAIAKQPNPAGQLTPYS
jgi:LysM repeat protein